MNERDTSSNRLLMDVFMNGEFGILLKLLVRIISGLDSKRVMITNKNKLVYYGMIPYEMIAYHQRMN